MNNGAVKRRLFAALISGAALVGLPSAQAVLLTVDGNVADLIAAQAQPISGSVLDPQDTGNDGFDIQNAWFHYDSGSDTFYFGMNFYGTAGNSGGLDFDGAAFDFLENYSLELDLGSDASIDARYSLAGDGVANSGPNTESLTVDVPAPATLTYAVSEASSGVEFGLGGFGFNGPFTVSLIAGSGSGPAEDSVSISGSVVPVPAAVWLFGSGLLVLARAGRRGK